MGRRSFRRFAIPFGHLAGEPWGEGVSVFEIHVFGGKTGESIAVRLPAGWGVLDAYAPVGAVPEVVSYLKERKVEELLFAGLTHPHADHFLGLRRVLTTFPTKKFFTTLTDRANLSEFRRAVEEEALGCASPDRSAVVEAQSELARLLSTAEQKTQPEILSASVPVYRDPDTGTAVSALAPGYRIMKRWLEGLKRDALILSRDVPCHPRHNLASAVIAIECAGTVALLMGDAEYDSLSLVLSDRDRRELVGKASLVKMAHHGSATSSFPDLWESVPPTSTILCTRSVRHGLPARSAVSLVGRRPVYCTGGSALAGGDPPVPRTGDVMGKLVSDLDSFRDEQHGRLSATWQGAAEGWRVECFDAAGQIWP